MRDGLEGGEEGWIGKSSGILERAGVSKDVYSVLLEGWGFWIIADVLDEDHTLMLACWCLGYGK